MDKQHFDQLVKGVREMKRHMAGKRVRGVRTMELLVPDVRTIREAAQISQSQFAKLIGVNLRTLQNWEQHRTLPTGPARVLLKIVASNPKAIKALHERIWSVSGCAQIRQGYSTVTRWIADFEVEGHVCVREKTGKLRYVHSEPPYEVAMSQCRGESVSLMAPTRPIQSRASAQYHPTGRAKLSLIVSPPAAPIRRTARDGLRAGRRRAQAPAPIATSRCLSSRPGSLHAAQRRTARPMSFD